MPRHQPKRDNREWAGEEIEVLEQQMHTYEETAVEQNANFEWKKDWRRLFDYPVPNKIHEPECLDNRLFSSLHSPFFIGQFDRKEEEEEANRRRAEPLEQDEQDESYAGIPEDGELNNWRMWECYLFCAKQVFWSRVWIFLLQFVASFLAGNRFRSNVFNLPERDTHSGQYPMLEWFVKNGTAGLRRWDAQHFLFIMDNHYIFEQSLAFFPGYPEIVNFARMAAVYNLNLKWGMGVQAWVLTGILSVLITQFFFITAGVVMFTVCLIITRNIKRSLLAVSLFCFNPASIFFSSAYSESMFLALTLTGLSMQLFALRSTSYFGRISGSFFGSTVFGLALVCRSNGILNLIYVGWYWASALLWETEPTVADARHLQASISQSRNERYKREATQRLAEFRRKRKEARKVFRWTDARFSNTRLFVVATALAFVTLLSYFIPYVFATNYIGASFCDPDAAQRQRVVDYTSSHRVSDKWVTAVNAFNRTSWCRKPKSLGLLPTYYGAVQAKYWRVGWFGYWKLKKIPCFLMMLPAAVITVHAILATWKDVFEKKRWHNVWVLLGRSDHLLPMSLHAAILLFTAVFYYNAEVFTRIIFSSGPFLYIYLAGWIDKHTQGNVPGNRLWHFESSLGILPFFVFRSVWNSGWRGKLLYAYFIGYFVFGTMAHAAWLPFT